MISGSDLIFVGLLVALLLPIGLTDLRQRRIPNLLNAGVGLLGLVHAAVAAPSPAALLPTVVQGALACLLFAGTGLLMRLVRPGARIGGGDLKLLVAASFWIGIDGSIATLLLACVMLSASVLVSAPWRGLDLHRLHAFGPLLAGSLLVLVVVTFIRVGVRG